MSSNKGILVAIEGGVCLNMTSLLQKLGDAYREEGYQVDVIEFPQTTRETGVFVREYLSGRYDPANITNPYAPSLFASMDRFGATEQIKQSLRDGKIVLTTGYIGNTLANEGAKIPNAEQRRGYFIWLDSLEFQMLNMPRPGKSIILYDPRELSKQPMEDEAPSINYQVMSAYDELCQLFPRDFQRLDYSRGGEWLTNEQVHNLLYNTLKPLLPKAASTQRSNNTSTIDRSANQPAPTNPYLNKTDNGWEITKAGKEFLDGVISNPSGDVYTFTHTFKPPTIAAAMTRLLRRGGNLRITILDEFASSSAKHDELLRRVDGVYDNDAIPQLVGQYVVVENASSLLAQQLVRGSLASYLEQPARYINFDQKDESGKFKYYTPEHLDALTKTKYNAAMDHIFEGYSAMVRALTDYLEKNSNTPKGERDGAWRSAIRAQACDAIRPVLPVATKSTVGIFASGQALEALIMRLRASESPEAVQTGNAILKEARKVIPTFLERADKPDRGGATTAYMATTKQQVAELSRKYLPDSYGAAHEPVKLMHVWPRNELDLVPHMLYESSNLSLQEIETEVAKWPVDRKIEVFNSYMGERLNRRHRPGRALEQAHYTWDLVCDYGIFRDLQRHRMVDDLQWQQLTPRYGYEVPALVEEAGLSDLFEKCFDLSAKLYSTLQTEGYAYEAQYATLLGHRMRWKITYNAREAFHFHELRTSPQGHPGYRKLVLQMHEKLAEVHPMLAEHMRFVNQDEDPELTRLAAERATQFKLQALDKEKS